MEDLIRQYREGRKSLRVKAGDLRERIKESDDAADLMDLKSDLSLINGMIRDMTEIIGLMTNSFHRMRDEKKIFSMDPHIISQLEHKEDTWDPDQEDSIRSTVFDEFSAQIEQRMDLLTSKQKDTLLRWIFEGKSFSQIALEDGVSRQAVYDRIFGNKSHNGAIKKLRGGEIDGHGWEKTE